MGEDSNILKWHHVKQQIITDTFGGDLWQHPIFTEAAHIWYLANPWVICGAFFFLKTLQFSQVSIIPPVPHTHIPWTIINDVSVSKSH